MTGIAVVGAGHWGPHLIRNFTDHLASQVLWVVEPDDIRRKAIGERFPGVTTTAELNDALEDPRVDGMVIATPTATHSAIAARSLEAGKHVLVEKPLSHSVQSGKSLVALAESNGLALMVGHVFLFNPAYRAAKEYIGSGSLGDLRYISMTRTNLGPVRIDVNAAWDLATHDIAVANYWLGARALEVSATAGSWINEGIDDVAFLTMTYPEGVRVHVEASWLNPRKRRFASVVGSDRMLTVDDMDLNEPLRIYNKGVVGTGSDEITDSFAGFRSKIREGEVSIPHVTGGEPLKAECEAFLMRIRGGNDTLSDGSAGLEVVAVLEAVDRSVAAGGKSTTVEDV